MNESRGPDQGGRLNENPIRLGVPKTPFLRPLQSQKNLYNTRNFSALGSF